MRFKRAIFYWSPKTTILINDQQYFKTNKKHDYRYRYNLKLDQNKIDYKNVNKKHHLILLSQVVNINI